jgi:hypothetical protein
MKIQNNSSNATSFGMLVKINANAVYYNGRSLISRSEIKALQEKAKGIAGENDFVDLMIGSVARISIADKTDFREGYTMLGKSAIGGKNALVNLNQTWLKSETGKMMRNPYEVINGYLDSVVANLKMRKVQK